jgi:hypothetical protein
VVCPAPGHAGRLHGLFFKPDAPHRFLKTPERACGTQGVMAARSPGALGLFDPGAPKTSHRCTVVFTPALRTRRINGLLHVMLESLSSIQREWTATKDMHLVRPSSMRRYGIATGPSPPIPQPVTIAIAPFIGTGWRHDKPKFVSVKKNFLTCARPVRGDVSRCGRRRFSRTDSQRRHGRA